MTRTPPPARTSTRSASTAHPTGAGNETWLTSEQLATVLGVHTRWVQERVTAKALPHHRVGRLVRFTPDDVRAIEKSMAVKPAVHRLRSTA